MGRFLNPMNYKNPKWLYWIITLLAVQCLTGVCFAAAFANVNFVTRWAVDLNAYACKSSKQNHPETKVRNEAAEDFLKLLKEWEKLCKDFSLLGSGNCEDRNFEPNLDSDDEEETQMEDNKMQMKNLKSKKYWIFATEIPMVLRNVGFTLSYDVRDMVLARTLGSPLMV